VEIWNYQSDFQLDGVLGIFSSRISTRQMYNHTDVQVMF